MSVILRELEVRLGMRKPRLKDISYTMSPFVFIIRSISSTTRHNRVQTTLGVSQGTRHSARSQTLAPSRSDWRTTELWGWNDVFSQISKKEFSVEDFLDLPECDVLGRERGRSADALGEQKLCVGFGASLCPEAQASPLTVSLRRCPGPQHFLAHTRLSEKPALVSL